LNFRHVFQSIIPVPHFTPLTQLIAISITSHIALAGARVTTALYALSLQASEFTLGTMIALFALFPMFFAVSTGRLFDRVGLGKPMILACLSIALGCALPSAIGGLPILYLAVILIGTGFMVINIGAQHAVGAMSDMKSRTTNFSWLSLGFSTSSFSGPVIAGFVIDHARFSVAYAVCCGFAIIALGFVVCSNINRIKTLSPKTHKNPGSAMDLLRDPEMRRIYIIAILLAAAWDLFIFVTPIQGSRLGLSASTIGLILGAFSAATFAVRLAMPWIARRYNEWHVLTAALILAVISYGIFPFMQQSISLMAVAAVLGLALGSSQPNVLSLLHHAAPPGRAGEAIGIRTTISNANQVAIPLAFGAAGTALGLFAVFWGISAMIGFGVPIAWRKAFGKRGETP
jgi:MFS family permease